LSDYLTLAEYHHLIPLQNFCVAIHQYSLAGTYDGTDIRILRQTHVTDFAFGDAPFTWSLETLMAEVQFLMGAVVVVIVAVPEGLPLSVTLALAFSMKTMAKENNLVKKMHACETIGAVNVIFTDKTGTLTQNMMKVVDFDVKEEHKPMLDLIGAVNSTASWSNGEQVLGNPTESAILKSMGKSLSEQLRAEYQVLSCIPFSSAYKYMVSHVQSTKTRKEYILIKGAPEVVARIIGQKDFLEVVAQQQERGRRAIAAAVIPEPINICFNRFFIFAPPI
jgi:Ca2+-transporting ATPase